MPKRRTVLMLGGVAVGALAMPRLLGPKESAVAADSSHAHDVATAASGTPVEPQIQTFARPMPVVPVLDPASSGADFDMYQVPIQAATSEILPGIQTPVLTFGGQFAGPTIRARTGRRTLVSYTNNYTKPVNVHLHGGHTPASSDGYPMDLIEPGQSKLYSYPNTQQGTTLWYHDHSHHTEAEHVYRGLHGTYIIEDEAERALELPSGEFDVPIMIRDSAFDKDGNLVVGGRPADRTTILVNGIPKPYFEVAARKYRFRLLNTGNSRFFKLQIHGVKLVQIGSDGGLLPAPVTLSELVLSSAERADVVIDFSVCPIGTKLVLKDPTAGELLQFVVTRPATDNSRLPDKLRELPPLRTPTVFRDVALSFGSVGGSRVGLVNGKPFDIDRVDFKIKDGDTEVWTLTSPDPVGTPHNFHMHLVQFQVLDRNGKPPLQQDKGLKDTVQLVAGETVRVQATFQGHLGKYMYHCHFLEHSSIGMMAQMEIVP
ncbi:multicopper oxidase family protein [Amycolatopsis nigrescens]|uniref:multicopper oxidase family protein n=1 Tax=Amycolatopsis nigrescens TaxID=381445 RepID=UPI0004757AC6|nr:multicopper oxidase family protein [Amycolatopsis nigrescens]